MTLYVCMREVNDFLCSVHKIGKEWDAYHIISKKLHASLFLMYINFFKRIRKQLVTKVIIMRKYNFILLLNMIIFIGV